MSNDTMAITTSTPLEVNVGQQWFPGLLTSVLFLIVCLSWGTTWLGIKVAVESVPPLTASGLRFLIAFPMFLAFALIRREPIFYFTMTPAPNFAGLRPSQIQQVYQ